MKRLQIFSNSLSCICFHFAQLLSLYHFACMRCHCNKHSIGKWMYCSKVLKFQTHFWWNLYAKGRERFFFFKFWTNSNYMNCLKNKFSTRVPNTLNSLFIRYLWKMLQLKLNGCLILMRAWRINKQNDPF